MFSEGFHKPYSHFCTLHDSVPYNTMRFGNGVPPVSAMTAKKASLSEHAESSAASTASLQILPSGVVSHSQQ